MSLEQSLTADIVTAMKAKDADAAHGACAC